MKTTHGITLLSIILLLGGLSGCASQDETYAQAVFSYGAVDISGFQRAEEVIQFTFPDDHGPHSDYQTEWWYYTGNLDADDGRHFGYQLTFFRRALIPPSELTERESIWSTSQTYMAHFALTDVDSESFYSYERFARGAAGIAGAQASPYRVWLENWQVTEVDAGIYRLTASTDTIGLDLLLTPEKPEVLQGVSGYSQKGPEPGNASYYYSYTRLNSSGTIHVAGTEVNVTGLSWMDHEFSTGALSEGQTGWDWFSIQLDDGSELMVFQLRQQDGSVDTFSSGTVIFIDGETAQLNSDDFSITPTQSWQSPHTGAIYPVEWLIDVPEQALHLNVTAYINDQEHLLSYQYWEGAVRVEGTYGNSLVTGHGYAELTGYTASMQGEF